MSLDLKKALLTKLKLEKAKRLLFEKYRQNPMAWLEERFNEPATFFEWSKMPGYEEHDWDGDKDPLASAWMTIGNAYAEMSKGRIPQKRWVGVESGTGLSKTFWLARLVFWFLDCFPNSLVVTSAPKQDQLKLGLWSEISMLLPRIKKLRPESNLFKLRLAMDDADFDPDSDTFESQSWHAVGFVAGVGAEEESAGKARGFHRKYMLIILEECTGMPLPVLTAFQNTSTGDNNFIVAVGNPDSEFDPLHVFCGQKNVAPFRVSAYDYPNIVLKKELFPGATTLTSIQTRSDTYGEGSPLWNAMVRGISPKQSKDSLIQLQWIEDCIAAEVDNEIASYNAVGVDVSNSEAGDKAATIWGSGNTVTDMYEFQCPNASDLALNLLFDDVKLQMESRIVFGLPKIKDRNIAPWCVGVDAVGVGVSTINAAEREGINFTALSGGPWDEAIPKEVIFDQATGKDKEKPMYKFGSLRAQMYWQAREDLRLKQIRFAVKNTALMNQLKKELCVPKVNTASAYIEVEKKDKIKERLRGKSPNLADAFVYWNWMRHGYRRPPLVLPVMGGG